MVKRLVWILKKILIVATVLFGITFISFILTYLSPSDTIEMRLIAMNVPYTEEYLNSLREAAGLNDPIPVQYFRWINNMIHGDMGVALQNGLPVSEQLFRYLPNTLKLTFTALSLTIIVSVVIGVFCATHANGVVDYFIRFITYIFASMPGFFLALILLYLFSVRLNWFLVSATEDFKGMILPVVMLSMGMSASYIRQIRTIVLDEMGKDYVIGCYARGIPRRSVIFKHVLKNCLIPIITLVGMTFGGMLGGSSIVEMIFNWPGIGRFALSSIQQLDIPVIQAYVVWTTLIFLTVNVLVDFVCAIVNPKLRKDTFSKKVAISE